MDNLKCSICLSDIKPGKDIKSTCEHVFHKKCLRTWTLDYNRHSCPICRDVIRVPKNKHRCHRCFHTYCRRNYRSPGLSLIIGSVMCNSLGYCCWCQNPDNNRKVSLEQYQEDDSLVGFTFNDEDETEIETIGEDNPNSSSVRPHSFMEIYNITSDEMASLRSENIQLWRRKFPLLTLGHLKQLNDQSVITRGRIQRQNRLRHLTNKEITFIFISVYPGNRLIHKDESTQMCDSLQITIEDIHYIKFLVRRWLPYYQVES